MTNHKDDSLGISREAVSLAERFRQAMQPPTEEQVYQEALQQNRMKRLLFAGILFKPP